MGDRFIGQELLAVGMMEGDVLFVPVTLFPVIGFVVLDELTDATSKLVSLEQQQLDDVEADVRLFALMRSKGLKKGVIK